MNARQYHALFLRETDLSGALNRLCGDGALYTACLNTFLDDPTTDQLNVAVEVGSWDEAFTAAHALKGVAGNLGFVPLMHSAGQLIVLIRGGRMLDIPPALEQVNSSYRDIIDAIHQYFAYADDKAEGDAI